MVGGVLPVVAVRAQGAFVVLVARATIVAIAIVWVVASVGALALRAVTVGAVAVRAVAVRRMNVRWAALSAAQSERVRAMRRVSRGADMAGL